MDGAASTPRKRPYRSRRIGLAQSQLLGRQQQQTVGSQEPPVPHSVVVDQGLHRRMVGRRRRQAYPNATIGSCVPLSASLLAAPTYCQKCGAKKFQYESRTFCCMDGQVQVANNPYPPELIRLFTSDDEDAAHFRKYCRLYNNMFAFSSLGGSITSTTKKGIYVFKLHGQIYHYLPDLVPADGKPKYLQLYFYDAEHEKENRAGLFKELRPDVVAVLMSVMMVNPYARFFRCLRERDIDEHTTIHINRNAVLDQRVYNAPASNEVAAIWPDSTGTSDCSGPSIVVSTNSNTTHRIKHYYGCYDPLQYPFLFPLGDNGWRPGLKKIDRTSDHQSTLPGIPVLTASTAEELLSEEGNMAEGRHQQARYISCREYYSYLLQIREGNYLLRAGRLLQQFIVDMYVKLENSRLDFFRNNQSTIRAELYQGIVDTFLNGETEGSNVGHRVVLPPSFIGGPRDTRRRYLNAMALVQRFGKPDIFLTMTCNPNWHEIKQELSAGEQAQNRPDLIARVFHAKLIALKKEITEKHVFGHIAAMIHVIEFQKRGLPHAHFLIILKPEYKIKAPEDFDKFVCAEIPSASQPHLRGAVLNHMMHGPCGEAHPECPCMKDKGGRRACKARYPKQFMDHTTNNPDGYPLYRRRDTGEVVTVRRELMDNRWVIPYNPYLLALFDCHINVEVCSTIQAVKYLYKYVYKGHDRVSFNVVQHGQEPTIDEIENFQSGRWVSPPEAAWRLFGFDLYDMHPPVMPLQVHLHNFQSIQFQSQESLSNIVSDEGRAKTPLTEFFRMNRERPDGEQYLYSEFPEHFTWDAKGKKWKDRRRGFVVGRLVFVNPSDEKRYYLRLLLAHVRGPKSFDDLRTVNGYLCASFQEAALKRGLIEQCDANDRCLTEAAEVQMPHALRRLFVTILIFNRPADPKALWDRYYIHLSEDFRHVYPDSEDKIFHETTKRVEQILEAMGRTLEEFSLDHLRCIETDTVRVIRDIQDVTDAPIPPEYIRARKELNYCQKLAYKSIVRCVKEGRSGLFFIDGPGGTGKTYLYCALYAKVRQLNKIVLPTASSGIAAANLPHGRTAHSRFKLPLDHTISMTCDVPKQGALASLLKETTLIIWDEAPMANKASIHSLDLLLRDLADTDVPFGGKIIVLGGDFRQVLPVVPRQTQYEAVEASLVSSHLWPHFTRFQLHENMRAREDPSFASFLLSLGNGEFQNNEGGLVELPQNIVLPIDEGDDPMNKLLQTVYPEMDNVPFDASIFDSRAILTPRNDEVDNINNFFISRFDGDAVVYKSFDTIIDESCNIYPQEFLNTLCPGGMSPHELILKKNCPIILLRNLDPSGGLCNGTRLICKQFFPHVIVCEIATGWYKGQQAMLPRVNLRPSSSSNFPFQFQRKQFPIKLCFAMTINKAQGQTLNEVGIYLRQPCFSHGQLYVALSRARQSSKVKVISKPTGEHVPYNLVRNVVSFEVLRRAGII